MKQKHWIVLGVILLVVIVSVAAILLLRQPPLIRDDSIESVVLAVSGRGHKEITDPAQQQQIIQLINKTERQKTSEDTGKGWHIGVYIYYTDGTRDTLWFAYKMDTPQLGVTEPTAEYMKRYQDGNYRVKDNTIVSLFELCESIGTPYSSGILPEERMLNDGLTE